MGVCGAKALLFVVGMEDDNGHLNQAERLTIPLIVTQLGRRRPNRTKQQIGVFNSLLGSPVGIGLNAAVAPSLETESSDRDRGTNTYDFVTFLHLAP